MWLLRLILGGIFRMILLRKDRLPLLHSVKCECKVSKDLLSPSPVEAAEPRGQGQEQHHHNHGHGGGGGHGGGAGVLVTVLSHHLGRLCYVCCVLYSLHTPHRVLPPATVGAGDDLSCQGPEAAPALLAAPRLIHPVRPLAVCAGTG